MVSNVKILAITPAYNAESTLSELVGGLARSFEYRDILVVDDGSRDKTSEIAKSFGVNLLRLSENSGKGAALRAGFKFAIDHGYDAVLTIDSDLQHPPELTREFIGEMLRSEADIVLGDRMDDIAQMPLQRRFSNKTTSFFVRLWTGEAMRDSQCGFRLIKTSVLERADLRVRRYQTETELLLEAARLGAKFAYVSIPTIYNGQPSGINAIVETLNYIGLMLSHPFRKHSK